MDRNAIVLTTELAAENRWIIRFSLGDGSRLASRDYEAQSFGDAMRERVAIRDEEQAQGNVVVFNPFTHIEGAV